MRQINICVLAIIGIVLLPTVASADIVIRSVAERTLADQIRAAGHSCPRVLSYDVWEGKKAEKLRKQSLGAYRVRCSNGRVFGVGTILSPWKSRFLLKEKFGGQVPQPVIMPLH